MKNNKFKISKNAQLGAVGLISKFRQNEIVSQMPVVGKKAPIYIKDTNEYETKNYLSFVNFLESRLGKLIISQEDNELNNEQQKVKKLK